MTRRVRSCNAGVTLLEVLLSLAVMAMIGTGIGSLFNTGGQVWARVENSETLPDQAIVRQQFRFEMEHMPTVTYNRPASEVLRFEVDGFSFLASVGTGEAQPKWVRVEVADDVLLIGGETAFSSLGGVHMQYFGNKTVRDTTSWYENWDQADLLPRLIKIESWRSDGTVNAPLTVQPAKITRQRDISLSSLVPPT